MLDEQINILRNRFAGTWQINRLIVDHALSDDAIFKGQARLWSSLDGLVYGEEGELVVGSASPLKAARRYFWQIQVPDHIDVYFEDGRYFHAFNPQQKTCSTEHVCAPDNYAVTYEFISPSRWQTIWQVQGPRKNYRMISVFTR